MDNNQISYFADIVSIIAGLMTMLGIGGIVTWSLSKKHRSTFDDRVVSIAVYSAKIFLCMLPLWLYPIYREIVLPISGALLRDGFGMDIGSWPYQMWWDKEHPAPYLICHIFFGLIIVPLYYLFCKSLFQWSLRPIKIFFRVFTNRHNLKSEELSEHNKANAADAKGRAAD